MKHLTDRQRTTALRPAERGQANFAARIAERTRTHWFTWRHVRFKLLETSQWGGDAFTLLQLEAVASRDTATPLTTTGYLAHGVDSEALSLAGGAVAYITAWLDRDAATRAYKDREFHWRQGDLFDESHIP